MPDRKSSLTLERVRQISDSLRGREAIERVFVYLDGGDLTQFLRRAVVAEWALANLLDVKAMVAYRGDGGSRDAVVACAPALAVSVVAEERAPAVLPLDWFDIGAEAPVRCEDAAWQREERSKPDLVLLPGMLSPPPGRIDGLAEAPPVFRLPEDFVPNDTAPAGWSACVDAALDASLGGALSARIEGDLGGIAIRIGPVEEGSADAVRQLIARVAGARLVVSSDPFHLTLASAFRIPCAAAGPVDFEACMWNPGDIVVAKAGRESLLAALDSLADRAPAPDRVDESRPAPGRINLPLKTRPEHLLDIRE